MKKITDEMPIVFN